MEHDPQPEAYLVHVWIRDIHPMLWRRFLVRSDCTLAGLQFRLNERFLYEYDFRDLWQLQVRLEQRSALEAERPYPVCVGGRWAGPPEDCGGPKAFLERRAAAPWRVEELLEGLRDDLDAGDIATVHDRLEQLQPWQEWLSLHRFDRRAVNRRLRQYAQGDQGWMNS